MATNGRKKRERRKVYPVRTAALVALSIAVIVLVYLSPEMGIALQWGISLVDVLLVGFLIRDMNGLKGWAFLYLLGSRRGLNTIDRLSRVARRFWIEMATWGLVLSFGVLSYPLFRKWITWKQYAFGMVSLAVILLLVLPYLSVALPLINIPQFQNAISSAQASAAQGINYLGIAFDIVTLLTGFAGYVFLALLYNAGAILYGIAQYSIMALNGTSVPSLLTSQLPGVAPIIPGIDIPLVAGIVSLALLLIVHEFSHGLLAREAKVRLKSIGLLVLGIIPVGAFVEPDDKQVAKLDRARQTRIFSAGISANFLAMLVFFLLMLAFMYFLVPNAIENKGVFISGTLEGYPAYNVLEPGMQVLSWNGRSVGNLSSFEEAAKGELPNTTIVVGTDNGTYTFRTKAVNATKGIIGIDVVQEQGVRPGAYAQSVYFLYTLFALSFMLNFLVAVVNLLPLPGFDGWQIYRTNIRSKAIIKWLMVLIIAGLLVNIFQWVFYI